MEGHLWKCKVISLSKKKPVKQSNFRGSMELEEIVDELNILEARFSKMLNLSSNLNCITKKMSK